MSQYESKSFLWEETLEESFQAFLDTGVDPREQRHTKLNDEGEEEEADNGDDADAWEAAMRAQAAALRQEAQPQDEPKAGAAEMESEEEYEVSRKAVEDKFKQLYDEDAELRQVLGKADPSTFSVEEKYQIIEAYM